MLQVGSRVRIVLPPEYRDEVLETLFKPLIGRTAIVTRVCTDWDGCEVYMEGDPDKIKMVLYAKEYVIDGLEYETID